MPVFFMITGYFYLDIVEKNGEIRQIKKIFKLVLEANALYLLWDSFYAVLGQNMKFFTSTFTVKNILKFIVFNESPLKGHLWYLGAILYVLIIVRVFDKLKIGKYLSFVSPFLLLGDLILGKYSVLLFGREFPYILVRNFLFVGIPYFCIGQLIRKGFGQKVKKKVLIVLMVAFSVTSLLERFILVSLNANAVRDHYISTTFLTVTVFLFALKCHRDNKTLALIGRKYSTCSFVNDVRPKK